MFAALERITIEEVEKLRRLAINSDSRYPVDKHGIPIDSNDIAYAIATPIQNSKRESGLEFSLTMWERTAHPRDVASSKKHMEVEKTNGSIHIGLHDDAGSQSIERFRCTLDSEIVSLQELLDVDSLLVGYTHPASEGVSGILSIIVPPKQDSATGKVIRLYYGDASVASIQKGAEMHNYAIPEKYRNVNLSPGEAAGIAGLEPKTTKGVKFLREIKGIFSGKTSARRAPFEKFVEALNKKGMLTGNVIANLEEAAETALSRYVPPTHGKNGVYPAAPDIKYESVLKHPEALLPDIETIAYILGRLSSGLRDNLFYRHPWITEDGTLKALETYLHFRAHSRNRNPSKQQLQLKESLEKLQAYEEKPSPIVNPSPSPALEKAVQVYYYSNSAYSEFGAALLRGDIKGGAFIYHSAFNEVGTIESLNYKDGMPNTISAVFTGNGQKILIVNLNEPDRFNIVPMPKGILLPDGTKYEGDGNDGMHPMDYILGREYNPTQIYRWISFGESKLGYTQALQVLAEEGTLVPGSDGNYTGESLARFAIARKKDDFFRHFGYKGNKKEVLSAAGRDLEERVGKIFIPLSQSSPLQPAYHLPPI